MANILAVAEQRDGTLRRSSDEAVTVAKTVAAALGGQVHAVVLGPSGSRANAAALGRFGADVIHVVESDEFALGSPEGAAATIADLVKGGDYFAVIFGGSSFGKDV